MISNTKKSRTTPTIALNYQGRGAASPLIDFLSHKTQKCVPDAYYRLCWHNLFKETMQAQVMNTKGKCFKGKDLAKELVSMCTLAPIPAYLVLDYFESELDADIIYEQILAMHDHTLAYLENANAFLRAVFVQPKADQNTIYPLLQPLCSQSERKVPDPGACRRHAPSQACGTAQDQARPVAAKRPYQQSFPSPSTFPNPTQGNHQETATIETRQLLQQQLLTR